MSKIIIRTPFKLEAFFRSIRERIGNLTFDQDGRYTVGSRGDQKKRTCSVYRRRNNALFRRAVLYAQKQIHDPVACMEYRRGITDRKSSIYLVAIADFLNPPKIHAIDVSGFHGTGDMIDIVATDDFEVVSVEVIITSRSGVRIEFGEARLVCNTRHLWQYKTTRADPTRTAMKITAIARDKAGNTTISGKLLDHRF